MKTFTYVITDALGIHARPAGLLVKEAQKYESRIVISCEGRKAEAVRLMALMSMGIRCGQEIQVEISGADEEAALEGIRTFLESNL